MLIFLLICETFCRLTGPRTQGSVQYIPLHTCVGVCVCSQCVSSACDLSSTLCSSLYNSGLWGLDPRSGPSQRTEGARQAPTTQSLTHLAMRPAGSTQRCKDQSSTQTSCPNMSLADHTVPVKGRKRCTATSH